jgi:hypothetical protein
MSVFFSARYQNVLVLFTTHINEEHEALSNLQSIISAWGARGSVVLKALCLKWVQDPMR